jgi:hypothetical protein
VLVIRAVVAQVVAANSTLAGREVGTRTKSQGWWVRGRSGRLWGGWQRRKELEPTPKQPPSMVTDRCLRQQRVTGAKQLCSTLAAAREGPVVAHKHGQWSGIRACSIEPPKDHLGVRPCSCCCCCWGDRLDKGTLHVAKPAADEIMGTFSKNEATSKKDSQ